MAQMEAIPPPLMKEDALAKLTDKEIREIEQYEKIVRFRDTVLSGNHPTIKLPPGLKALALSLPHQLKSRVENTVTTSLSETQTSVSENAKPPAVETNSLGSIGAPPAPQSTERPFTSGRTEINPIFLQKSDELIKAELQLQRQKLERALKDEVEQRRASKHAEPLVVVDLSDVLTKALSLVGTTATPLPVDKDLTANHEAASDSFDDDTFYSSRHITPVSNLTSRIRNSSEDVQILGVSQSHQNQPPPDAITRRNHPAYPLGGIHRAAPPQAASHLVCLDSPTHNTGSRPHRVMVPGLNNYIHGGSGSSTQPTPTTGRDAGNREGEAPVAQHGLADNSLGGLQPAPPPVRGHDRFLPVAPHIVQDSSLAVTGEPASATPVVGRAMGTPAQVVALRHEPTTVTSSDTSSQGDRDAEKRKGKRKKRKVDGQAPESETGPFIKPEPRSPSPMTAPSYIRPNKRQKQSRNQDPESGPAGSSYSRPLIDGSYDPHQPQIYRDERVPIAYEGPASYSQRRANTIITGEAGFGREYVGDHAVSGTAYMRRPASPGGAFYQYSPRGAHPARAVSQFIVNDPFREPPRAFRDPLDGRHTSMRPESDSFILPSKPPPTRIVVDAYGREYIEPPHLAPRQSVAPSARAGEPEVVFERIPARAISRHPGVGPYDEGGVVYARPPPPAYAVARRYVTQPEYVPHEYRDHRLREYSTQPMGPGEYVRVLTPQDRRPVDEGAREYLPRTATMRPPDGVGYEAPYHYGRVQSVRPDVAAREYAGSVHAENRHPEGAPTYVREYEGGPVQQQQQQPPPQQAQQQHLRREYSVRPAERYNEPHGGRATEDIAFIEGPRRQTQEIVYVDDGRREVYR